MRLTMDQKVEIILLCGRDNLSYRQIADIFNERHATVPPLNFSTVGRLLNKFKETGSVHDKKYERGVPEEDQELVLANAFANPKDSLTKQSKATGFSRSKVRSVLKKHKMKSYKPRRCQAFNANDPPRRVEMAEWFLGNIRAQPTFLKSVLFSDESLFPLNGTKCRQHETHWADSNPHLKDDCRRQDVPKVMVWLGVHDERLVGPYFFDNTVNGQTYLEMLRTKMIPDLRASGNFPVWFQQDGAPPHYLGAVRDFLDVQFPGLWIGRGGWTEWSARSPDLNPLDFAMWSIIKDRVYDQRVETIDALKARITDVCNNFEQEILQNINRNFHKRVELCIQENGGHFEHLL